MKLKLIHLEKEKWKDTPLVMDYQSEAYYDVLLAAHKEGFRLDVFKKLFDVPYTFSSKDKGYPDKLYEDYREDPYAWGYLDGERLVAALETSSENWSNRLRISELFVEETYRRKGLGHHLMAIAKEQTRREKRSTAGTWLVPRKKKKAEKRGHSHPRREPGRPSPSRSHDPKSLLEQTPSGM